MAKHKRPYAPRPPTKVSVKSPRNFFADKSWILAFVLILAAALLAYHDSFTGPFIFDDTQSIPDNPHIRHLWPLSEALKAPDEATVTGRPMVSLSLALNYAWGGLNVWGFHAFNLAVHILAALSLYGVVRRTLLSKRLQERFASSANGLALTVALIWTVHPLQTESVTYTIQRAESLMGLFYLLTLYYVIRGAGSSRSSLWQLCAVVSCVAGMATKEVMVTAPVVVLLYDRVFLAQSWREVQQRRWPVYAGMAATWLLLRVLMTRAPGFRPTTGFGYKEVSPQEYALTQPGVILHYLRLSFWPHPLCLDYGLRFGWPVARSVGEALPGLVVVVGLLALTVWLLWRIPALGFVCATFFLILTPTSSFVPMADLAFEHRMYLSLAAVITMAVIGGHEGLALVARRMDSRNGQRPYVAYAVVGVIVATLVYVTVHRNQDYRSEVSIWTDTVAKRPQNPRAHNNLGKELLRMGQAQQAIDQFKEALRITPANAEPHNNWAIVLSQAGQLPEAIAHYEQALRIRPLYAEAHANFGLVLLQVGRTEEAIQHYEQALQLQPNDAVSQSNLGNALAQTGKLQEAIAHYRQALLLQPDFAEAHNNLGAALERLGKIPEAISHYQQALRINPYYADARNNLARALTAP